MGDDTEYGPGVDDTYAIHTEEEPERDTNKEGPEGE